MGILRVLNRARRRGSAKRLAVLTVTGPVVVGAAVLATALSSSTPAAQVRAGTLSAARAEISEGELGEDPAAPGEYLELKQSSARPVSLAQIKRARRQARAIATATDDSWQLIGPSNIGGRVTDLVIDPSQANTLYIAASGGGIWKSTDAAATFTPVWPDEYVQNIGAIARGPDGALWVGTGEANPSGGGLTFTGDGVYKSTDGGQTWQNVGLTQSASIGRIVVNPQNADEVWVAAAGWLSYSAAERGLYHTTDGGQTWQLALVTPNATTGAIDVALAPGNPSRVYAALWDHKRNNGARTYGGIGSGLFRSDTSGDQWTRLENVVVKCPATDPELTGLSAHATLGRIGVAVAPSDANRVYVVSGTPYGPEKGSYISVDGGTTFTCGGPAYQAQSGYQWWFGRVWVDPDDPNHAFNADVSLQQTTTSGVAWAPVTGPHADQHGMEWDPNVEDRVYLGNDGGVYRSDNNGTTWTHATYQPWNQSYHMAVSQQRPSRLATGLQDNGSVRTWTATNPNPTNLTQWNSFGGGDGHYVAIEATDDTYYYECFQPSPPSHSCDGRHDTGTSTTNINFGSVPGATRWTTDTPLAIDPSNPMVVYIGGNVLGRSTDRGVTFTAISPADDANSLPGPVPPEQNDLGPFYADEYAAITAITPAKTAPNTIYVGTDTGRVWKTTDLGTNWTRLGLGVLPDLWVNAIVADPTNENHAFVAFSGYREGNHSANVWVTTNGGTTWSNISANLPNAPVEMLTYNQPRDQLFAATDFGVFYLASGATSWIRLGVGLPNTPVLDVKLSGDGQTLFAATFGRSVWKVAVPQNPTAVRLRSFSATRAGNAVRLRWRTGAEARLLGFDLYRSTGTRSIKLNRSVIPAHGKLGGGSYSYLHRRRAPARYRLRAVRLDGSRVWLGSATVS